MKCGVQVGLALTGGYLLGRTKRMKLALVVGGVVAGRKLSTSPGQLLNQGADMLRSNEQVEALVEQARTGLLQAGKAAAIAAATGKMEAVTGRLTERAASLGPTVPGKATESAEDEDSGEQSEDETLEDEAPEDEAPEDEAPEDEAPEGEESEDEEPASRPSKRARRPAANSRNSSDDTGRPSRQSPQRRRKPAKASSGSSERGGGRG